MRNMGAVEVMERFLLDKEERGKSQERRISDAVRLSESQITQSCVRWFRLQYPQYASVLIHPANEGARSTKVVRTSFGTRVVSTGGARLKAEGLVPGVADLLLLVPRKGCGCLAVEMKTPAKSSRQSERQVEWEKAAIKAGNCYCVCAGLWKSLCPLSVIILTVKKLSYFRENKPIKFGKTK